MAGLVSNFFGEKYACRLRDSVLQILRRAFLHRYSAVCDVVLLFSYGTVNNKLNK